VSGNQAAALVHVAVSSGPQGAFVVGVSRDREAAIRAAVGEVAAWTDGDETQMAQAQAALRAANPANLASAEEWTTDDGELTVSVQAAQMGEGA
jgi:hypothetical protein